MQFAKLIIFHLVLVIILSVFPSYAVLTAEESQFFKNPNHWPILKHYDQKHISHIALPLGGIGTGTVSLGGRGDLRDWEIMNRPAKDFMPNPAPFFAISIQQETNRIARALEGPLSLQEYEGAFGSTAPNHGLPRFRNCSFDATYPFGRVNLSDPDMPVDVAIEAFNPLIPGNSDLSGIPIAVLSYQITNKTASKLKISVCGNIPNFIGNDGTTNNLQAQHSHFFNHNAFQKTAHVQGVYLTTACDDSASAQWGTMALTTSSENLVSYRTAWYDRPWGGSLLDYWDDFSHDGKLEDRQNKGAAIPMASLAVEMEIPAGETKTVQFFLTWHFPNRMTWTPQNTEKCTSAVCCNPNLIGNYYTSQYKNAWDVAERIVPQINELHTQTCQFVQNFCASDFPDVVKEAALFNVSTLRSQTCFRTPDGRLYGFEGCSDKDGCCLGSCTHVWNYEQTIAFLFGDLAKSMRDVEFNYATDSTGLMSFRVHLPLIRAQEYGVAAADGQMGCIMKMYRDWQLSGDEQFLAALWPKVKQAMEFCWIDGGWDADQDGVMDGCQHNTMDVEYFGPNPQMGIWYLGALRACEEMAIHLHDKAFAKKCGKLYKNGSAWIDKNLFNGEYYEHHILPPENASQIAKGLRHNMGAHDVFNPDYQLGSGCLVDQLIGQLFAHVCGFGYLTNQENVQKTLKSIMQYNYKSSLHDHFNSMRSFALGDEAALLMASYPNDRPQFPFPYFTEVMTGFEYTAAIGMLYEGQTSAGLQCMQNVRNRYDGRKRNPFDEAECGHHYARAMISWAAVLALSDFHYSAVNKSISFTSKPGTYFWSTGYAWGNCTIGVSNKCSSAIIAVQHGSLELHKFEFKNTGVKKFKNPVQIHTGEKLHFTF